jgi:hypothetical protein
MYTSMIFKFQMTRNVAAPGLDGRDSRTVAINCIHPGFHINMPKALAWQPKPTLQNLTISRKVASSSRLLGKIKTAGFF